MKTKTTLQHVIPAMRFDEWRVKRDFTTNVIGIIKITSVGMFVAHRGEETETFDTIKKAQLWIERQAGVRR